MASPRTLSPRNSRRSYESERCSAQEECVKTCARRSSGSASISARRSAYPVGSTALLMGRDVLDGLPDRLNPLGVLVGDLDPERVLELHDQLHEIERVGVEVLLEGRLLVDVALVDAEL